METEENLPATNNPKFFYIPVSRLVIMSIVTIGVYQAYWIYKNWKYLKGRYNMNIAPFWRGIFGVFFIHSLLNHIIKEPEVNKIRKAEFSASGLATGWVIISILGGIFMRFLYNDIEKEDIWDIEVSSTLYLLGMIILPFLCLFFLPVQKYINSVNDSIEPRPSYSELSGGHYVCLVIGILTWIFSIYTLFSNLDYL